LYKQKRKRAKYIPIANTYLLTSSSTILILEVINTKYLKILNCIYGIVKSILRLKKIFKNVIPKPQNMV